MIPMENDLRLIKIKPPPSSFRMVLMQWIVAVYPGVNCLLVWFEPRLCIIALHYYESAVVGCITSVDAMPLIEPITEVSEAYTC